VQAGVGPTLRSVAPLERSDFVHWHDSDLSRCLPPNRDPMVSGPSGRLVPHRRAGFTFVLVCGFGIKNQLFCFGILLRADGGRLGSAVVFAPRGQDREPVANSCASYLHRRGRRTCSYATRFGSPMRVQQFVILVTQPFASRRRS
jgi:hypothetical protein